MCKGPTRWPTAAGTPGVNQTEKGYSPMKNYAKKAVVSLFAGAALLCGAAAPASAQPVVTGGLVNVTVVDLIDGDVLSNNNVAVGAALGIAANVCGVGVNVLAQQLGTSGPISCTSDAGDQRVDITQATRR